MAFVLLPCDLPTWPTVSKHLRSIRKSDCATKVVQNLHNLHELCNVGINVGSFEAPPPDYFASLEKFLQTDVGPEFFSVTLPAMVDFALQINQLKPLEGLQYSLQQEDKTFSLRRNFVAALLAHLFFCTWPRRSKTSHPTLTDPCLGLLMSSLHRASQRVKLKCFLNYFHILATHDAEGFITYSRKVMDSNSFVTMNQWRLCSEQLCPFNVKDKGCIQDCSSSAIAICFSSPDVARPTLTMKNSQQVATMMAFPETLATAIVAERLEDNEAFQIIGALQVAKIIDLKTKPTCVLLDKYEIPDIVHTLMDADDYSQDEFLQYEETNVLRELNKSFLGFYQLIQGETEDSEGLSSPTDFISISRQISEAEEDATVLREKLYSSDENNAKAVEGKRRRTQNFCIQGANKDDFHSNEKSKMTLEEPLIAAANRKEFIFNNIYLENQEDNQYIQSVEDKEGRKSLLVKSDSTEFQEINIKNSHRKKKKKKKQKDKSDLALSTNCHQVDPEANNLNNTQLIISTNERNLSLESSCKLVPKHSNAYLPQENKSAYFSGADERHIIRDRFGYKRNANERLEILSNGNKINKGKNIICNTEYFSITFDDAEKSTRSKDNDAKKITSSKEDDSDRITRSNEDASGSNTRLKEDDFDKNTRPNEDGSDRNTRSKEDDIEGNTISKDNSSRNTRSKEDYIEGNTISKDNNSRNTRSKEDDIEGNTISKDNNSRNTRSKEDDIEGNTISKDNSNRDTRSKEDDLNRNISSKKETLKTKNKKMFVFQDEESKVLLERVVQAIKNIESEKSDQVKQHSNKEKRSEDKCASNNLNNKMSDDLMKIKNGPKGRDGVATQRRYNDFFVENKVSQKPPLPSRSKRPAFLPPVPVPRQFDPSSEGKVPTKEVQDLPSTEGQAFLSTEEKMLSSNEGKAIPVSHICSEVVAATPDEEVYFSAFESFELQEGLKKSSSRRKRRKNNKVDSTRRKSFAQRLKETLARGDSFDSAAKGERASFDSKESEPLVDVPIKKDDLLVKRNKNLRRLSGDISFEEEFLETFSNRFQKIEILNKKSEENILIQDEKPKVENDEINLSDGESNDDVVKDCYDDDSESDEEVSSLDCSDSDSSRYSFSSDYSSDLNEIYGEMEEILRQQLDDGPKGPRSLAIERLSQALLKRGLSESYKGIAFSLNGITFSKGERSASQRSLSLRIQNSITNEQSYLKMDLNNSLKSLLNLSKGSKGKRIVTGNWGCGNSKGDPQIKALIQWAAASRGKAPFIYYYSYGNENISKLAEVVKIIQDRGWSVGDLIQAVLGFCEKRLYACQRQKSSLPIALSSSPPQHIERCNAPSGDFPNIFEELLEK